MSTRPKLISGGLLLILAIVAVACSDTTTPAALPRHLNLRRLLQP